ncbi:MAG: YihY/virulence factor BrkB family protein, partial [Pseudomonadota bacterium]
MFKVNITSYFKNAWGILAVAFRSYRLNGGLNLSAAIAFYSILSLIPLLFLLLSVTGYILGSSEEAYRATISFITERTPQIDPIVLQEAKRIVDKAEALGWMGILFLIWTASLIFSSLESAFNTIFKVINIEKRRYFYSKLLTFAMIPLGCLILTISILITGFAKALEKVSTFVLLGIDLRVFFHTSLLVRYLIPFLLIASAVTLVYKTIPNIKVPLRHCIVGGTVCAFLWEGVKYVVA